MKHVLLRLCSLLPLLLLPIDAGAVVVEDCASAPVQVVNKTTVIDLPGEEVTLRCALTGIGRSQRVAIHARTITIDGPGGGSISADAKSNAITLQASETIHIDRASIAAENPNGDAKIIAAAGISITETSALRAGDILAFECTASDCEITLSGISAEANRIMITADGSITISPRSVLSTTAPTDLIRIVSTHGDVLAGGGIPVTNQASARGTETPVVLTGFDRAVMLAAAEFCLGCEQPPPNQITTSLEGGLDVQAPDGMIDLSAAEVTVGEAIALSAASDVRLAQASIQNCGPKRGKFRVTSTTCQIDEATLLDDDPDPEPQLSCSAEGTPTLLGTCSARR